MMRPLPQITRLLFISLIVFVGTMTVFLLGTPKTAHAAYQSGSIIDDSVFLDAKSMSIADIQNFLAGKNSGLRNMQFVLSCYGADSTERQLYISAGAACDTPIPASQIIYYAAQIYGVNPRVILTTMQKEQSLTTAANPTSWQLNQAMGYACPTSGSCESSSSFPYQIDSGTWALRYHFERARGNLSWWKPATSWVCGTEKHLYKPNLYPGQNVRFYDTNGTHYTTVFIQNAATSAFYCYTPHAYNNPRGEYGRAPYGTTGLYYSGSYNFVYYFELWFGSTEGTPFFQLPGSSKTYITGANNSYYAINSYSTLQDYGFESVFRYRVQQVPASYTTGKTDAGWLPSVARFEDIGISLQQSGVKYPFSTEDDYFAYGYAFGQEAVLPKWVGSSLGNGSIVRQIARSNTGGPSYLIQAGKKSAFCSWEALSLLGTPTYASRQSVGLNASFLRTLPDTALIAFDGDIIRSTTDSSYRVYQGSGMSNLNKAVGDGIQSVNCSAPSPVLALSPSNVGGIDNLVKNSAGSLYIIDRNKKMTISQSEAINQQIALDRFVTISDRLLNKLGNGGTLPTLVRVNNSAGVHKIVSGKRFGVPTEFDLYGLGHNFSEVKSITDKTFSLFTDGGLAFSSGRVVRVGNDKGVFMLSSDFKKHPFTTEGTFLGYGYTWGDVLSVDAAWIKSYETAATHVKKYAIDARGAYWIIDGGKRYAIPQSLAGATHYNLSSLNVTRVDDYTLTRSVRAQNMKTVFRAGNDKAVYIIENGQKRAFASEAPFFNRGFTWNDVVSLSHEYVNSLASGDLIH